MKKPLKKLQRKQLKKQVKKADLKGHGSISQEVHMKKFEGFGHGINLGGWLSQCDYSKERFDNFITEDDIRTIASWGLDHIRLPIDYNLVETDEGDYKEDGFSYIDKTVEWCERYGLNLIIDLHKTYGYSFDYLHNEYGFFENERYQERFYRLWEELAGRYGNKPSSIAFELLNEVTDKEYCDTWNRVAANCIKRIRAVAPEVKILIGGYYNNCIEAIVDLDMPADENIVYNFHFYEPLIFTHQGAFWVKGMDTSFRISVEAPYSELEKCSSEQFEQMSLSFDAFDPQDSLSVEYFEKSFAKAVEICEERGVALYCGEYGVIAEARAEDTLKWYQMISGAFEKYNIGRAAWTYKEMDFGITDPHMQQVREDLIALL